MSNLQLIMELCTLVEQQAKIISSLSVALTEAGFFCEEIDKEIRQASQAYRAILGADEAPDFLGGESCEGDLDQVKEEDTL